MLPELEDREDEHDAVEAEHDQDGRIEVILKRKSVNTTFLTVLELNRSNIVKLLRFSVSIKWEKPSFFLKCIS